MPFDTLTYARTLETAGVPRQQAEAHAQGLADFLSTELVTKADLVRIEERLAGCATKIDLETLRGMFRTDLETLRSAFHTEFETLRGMFRTDLETLRGQVNACATKTDLATLRGEILTALERVYVDNARLETRLTRYVLVSSTIVGLLAAAGVAAKWL